MSRENLNRCMHDNCFTCPYRDCISNREPPGSPFGRTERIKLSPEEKRQRKRERQRKYDMLHQAERAAKAREIYKRKKEGMIKG